MNRIPTGLDRCVCVADSMFPKAVRYVLSVNMRHSRNANISPFLLGGKSGILLKQSFSEV